MVERHYQKNHTPKPPSVSYLNAIANSNSGHPDASETSESDTDTEPRWSQARRNSKGSRKKAFTQLKDYPAHWRKVLDAVKKIACRDAVMDGSFNNCITGLKCAGDSLAEALAAHQEDGGRVEKGTLFIHDSTFIADLHTGYFPQYQDEMQILVLVYPPPFILF